MPSLLIVEDNEQMRRMIRAVVAELASPIYECADGSKAVESYAVHRPACVLMDIELPGTDGISATGQITRVFPDARVIMVTEHGSPRLRDAARQAGASGYVLKENLRELSTFLAPAAP